MNSIPSKIKQYFWEVDASRLDPRKHPEYVIGRILEYGDPGAIRWAWRLFLKKHWRSALRLREVSPKTRFFWLPLVAKKK